MIYILHGEDLTGSYNHLKVLLKNYSSHHIIRLSYEDNKQHLQEAVSSQNLFEDTQLIISEDFLSLRKISVKDIQKLPESSNLIFWEKKKLKIPKTLQKNISIYEYKLPSTLFLFLDSMSPQVKKWLPNINKINEPNLIWHITYRFLVMILAKNDLNLNDAATFLERPIAPWQWQKVTNQARVFPKSSLYKIYSALLKLDYMKKQGQAQSADTTLISMLFLRHLNSV